MTFFLPKCFIKNSYERNDSITAIFKVWVLPLLKLLYLLNVSMIKTHI